MANESLAIELVLKSGKFAAQMGGMSKEFKDAEKALKEYGARLQKTGAVLAAFGASIVGPMALSVKATAEAADAIEEMGQRTGFSVTALQELNYVSKLTGASLSDVEVAAKTMQRNLGGAGEESKTLTYALKDLGLNINVIKNLAPEEQFFTIAEAIGRVEDPTTRAGLALNIFGRNGTSILPMLANGAQGLKAMRQEAHDLGAVMSAETIKAGAQLNDNFDKIKASAAGLRNVLAANLTPAAEKITEAFIGVSQSLQSWSREHPQLSKNIILLGTALGGLTLALGGFIAAAGTVIAIAPTLATAWTVMLGPVGALTAAMTGLVAVTAAYSSYVSKIDPNVEALKAAQVAASNLKQTLDAMAKRPQDWTPEKIDEVSKAYMRQLDTIKQLQKTVDLRAQSKTPSISTPSFSMPTVSSADAEKARKAAIKAEDMDYQNRLANLARFSKSEQQAFYTAEIAKTQTRLAAAEQGSEEYYTLLTRYGEQERALYALNAYSFVSGWQLALSEVANAGLNWSAMFQGIFTSLQGSLSNSFVSAIHDIGNGWSSFADTVSSLAKTMKDAVIKAFADMAAQWLVQRTAMFLKEKLFTIAEIKLAAVLAEARAIAASAWSLFGAFAIGAAMFAGVMALAGKFEQGGFVNGNSFSGDRMIARVNSGEAILNPAQQRNFMNLANGNMGQGGTNGTINFSQTVNISGADASNISAITQAVKRGTADGLELANAMFKQGQKQNGYAV